jgi:hypothetical protein
MDDIKRSRSPPALAVENDIEDNPKSEREEVPWQSSDGTKQERNGKTIGLLSEEQIAQCARADVADTFRSPVPTRQVSNGEYMPILQTEEQQRVEARIKELADSSSKKLGVSRRKFLAGTGGMAAAFLAMNEVFGGSSTSARWKCSSRRPCRDRGPSRPLRLRRPAPLRPGTTPTAGASLRDRPGANSRERDRPRLSLLLEPL